MRIISCNVNGIRAATRKGFFDWFNCQQADILCLQEIKAHEHQIPEAAKPGGYHHYYHCAEKPGYSGVALYSRRRPDAVHIGLGAVDPDTDWRDMDAEGRYVQADFGNLSVISVYFPSGSSSEARQSVKYAFLDRFFPWMKRLEASGREIILCGDINIAHHKIDLKNWRGNQKNSGFLPEERAWMDRLFEETGFVDAFRRLYPGREQYTWWSNRGRAREKNIGWRIDYHICTSCIASMAREVYVFTGKWYSDHAPVSAVFDGDLS